MIVIECQQGTEQWFEARAGAITASMFSEVRRRVGGLDTKQKAYVDAIQAGETEDKALEISGYKAPPRAEVVKRALAGEKVGDFTEAAKDYAFNLAVERRNGCARDQDQFETYAMRRGKELEDDARALHERRLGGVFIEQAGVVLTDDRKFGYSTDGFIGDDGSSEYKCFIDGGKVRRILFDGTVGDVADQMQGGLWITGRSWCDFALYYPDLKKDGLELIVHRVYRDEEYIEALEKDLLEFDALVESYAEKIGALSPNSSTAPTPGEQAEEVCADTLEEMF